MLHIETHIVDGYNRITLRVMCRAGTQDRCGASVSARGQVTEVADPPWGSAPVTAGLAAIELSAKHLPSLAKYGNIAAESGRTFVDEALI